MSEEVKLDFEKLLWHKKNAQLEMNELDTILAEELEQISGSISANYIETIKQHTAQLAGFKYDEFRTITPEDHRECILIGHLENALKVYVNFYVICQIDLKAKEETKVDQLSFKEKFPQNYHKWIVEQEQSNIPKIYFKKDYDFVPLSVFTDKDKPKEVEFEDKICASFTTSTLIFKDCKNDGILDLIMLNQLERFSDDVDDLGDEFSYQESMGPKECLAFFEGHVLPVSKDRLILLKLPNMNPI